MNFMQQDFSFILNNIFFSLIFGKMNQCGLFFCPWFYVIFFKENLFPNFGVSGISLALCLFLNPLMIGLGVLPMKPELDVFDSFCSMATRLDVFDSIRSTDSRFLAIIIVLTSLRISISFLSAFSSSTKSSRSSSPSPFSSSWAEAMEKSMIVVNLSGEVEKLSSRFFARPAFSNVHFCTHLYFKNCIKNIMSCLKLSCQKFRSTMYNFNSWSC